MKRRNWFPLLLALLLLLSLAACGKAKSDPTPPSGDSSQTDNQKPPQTENMTSLRLALPDGVCSQVVAKIPNTTIPVQVKTVNNSEEAKDFLLKNNSTDLILLTPQSAAELYRNGNSVQLVALVSFGEIDDPNRFQCLVATSSFLENNHDVITRFLSAYETALSSQPPEGAYLATGWDMVDLVQQDLEDAYAKHPDANHTIPDGTFYYQPS